VLLVGCLAGVFEVVSSWCVVAVLILLAESVKDITEILQCLLGCRSQCTAEELLDCLYCIASFLLAFKTLRMNDIWTQSVFTQLLISIL